MTLRVSPFAIIALLSLGSHHHAQAFNIFPQPVQNLLGMAESLQVATQSLDLSLNVGDGKEGSSTLGLQGLKLELGTGAATAAIKMPGANGPHPKLSSGIKELQVKAQGWFTSMTGRENVDINNGCWELVWKDGAAAGALICAVDVVKDAIRNGAKLPAGKLYMSFPIWTHEGFAMQQARMASVETMAQGYLAKRDEEMEKMQSTNNILEKALHYRNACLAVENYSLTGLREMKKMTPSPGDVLELNDLIFTKQGTIWTKNGMKNQLLGSAQVNVDDDEKDQK